MNLAIYHSNRCDTVVYSSIDGCSTVQVLIKAQIFHGCNDSCPLDLFHQSSNENIYCPLEITCYNIIIGYIECHNKRHA